MKMENFNEGIEAIRRQEITSQIEWLLKSIGWKLASYSSFGFSELQEPRDGYYRSVKNEKISGDFSTSDGDGGQIDHYNPSGDHWETTATKEHPLLTSTVDAVIAAEQNGQDAKKVVSEKLSDALKNASTDPEQVKYYENTFKERLAVAGATAEQFESAKKEYGRILNEWQTWKKDLKNPRYNFSSKGMSPWRVEEKRLSDEWLAALKYEDELLGKWASEIAPTIPLVQFPSEYGLPGQQILVEAADVTKRLKNNLAFREKKKQKESLTKVKDQPVDKSVNPVEKPQTTKNPEKNDPLSAGVWDKLNNL